MMMPQQANWSVGSRRGSAGFSWISIAALFAFLTLNSGLAVYHPKADETIVVFVAISYFELLMLFWSVWLHVRAAPGSRWRNMLTASVWVLTVLLTFTFAFAQMVMGSSDLTLPVALLVWTIAAATGIGGFFTFFQHDRINQMVLPISSDLLDPASNGLGE